ncbi:MAG: hypothetical protein AMJ81_12610 [Phycisphaerae bacterium SM23_33]|nr:MAG: hypothetical protein AMJ81_12610 [Phycisphaerae bacterium SM23_33]
MLVITCVGVAGITVLLAALYWIRTHPTFVEKGPEGTRSLPGRPLDQRPGGTAEGSSGGPGGAVTAGRPGEAVPAASRPISPAEEPQGDPKLLVSAPKLRDAGAVGEMRFVCGSVLSKYTVSLGEVSVTAYVDGLRGPSASYPFIRPGGTILYCLPLYVEDMDESRLKIVAEARQARPGLVVWDIPIQEIRRAGDAASERTVWTGKVRNRADFPVKNIRVVLDYYDDEGVWGGRAEGRLEDRTTLEPGSSGFFRVTTGELSALEVTTSRVLVARAVAEKL